MALIPFLFSLSSLLSLVFSVNAVALTTALSANERLCFYADVDKAGEKLGVCLCIHGLVHSA
jgi:hypothetical protein